MTAQILTLILTLSSLAAAQTTSNTTLIELGELTVEPCAPVMHEFLWDANRFKIPAGVYSDGDDRLEYIGQLKESNQPCDKLEAFLQACIVDTAAASNPFQQQRICLCGGDSQFRTMSQMSQVVEYPEVGDIFKLQDECNRCYDLNGAGRPANNRATAMLEYLKEEMCKDDQERGYLKLMEEASENADEEAAGSGDAEEEEDDDEGSGAGKVTIGGGAIAAMVGAAMLL